MNFAALGETCEIIMGQAPAGHTYNDRGEGLSLIAGASDFGLCSPLPSRFTTAAVKKCVEGDIILCIRATIGDLNWADKEYCLGRGVAALRAKSGVADSRYIWRAVEAAAPRLSLLGKGATFKQVSRLDIQNLSIPLPSLSEQKRIAAILDQTEELRGIRRRSLARLANLDQSIFGEMFGDPVTNPKGWDTVKLGDLCEVSSSKRVFVSEFVEKGVPFYRGTEVGILGAGGRVKPDLHISSEHYDTLIQQSGKPQIGDLLLPSICHDGRIWKVDHGDPFYFKDGRVLWIKAQGSSINGDYLRSLLRNMLLHNYRSIASGTTFAELKIVNLKNLQILFPPTDLQVEYASRINTVEQCFFNFSLSMEVLDSLFTSLQHRAFRGEL